MLGAAARWWTLLVPVPALLVKVLPAYQHVMYKRCPNHPTASSIRTQIVAANNHGCIGDIVCAVKVHVRTCTLVMRRTAFLT